MQNHLKWFLNEAAYVHWRRAVDRMYLATSQVTRLEPRLLKLTIDDRHGRCFSESSPLRT
jgi:hypothetical protein